MSPILKYLALVTIFLAALAGSVPGQDKIPIFVSIAPQRYFVQQIGQDLVDVRIMVEPGASPATYEPKPRQMVALARTKIYFAIGVAFEAAWLQKIAAASPGMKVVATDLGIEKLPMETRHHHHDDDDDETGHAAVPHEQGRPDPHIWLAPTLVKMQARAILAALQEVDPAHQDIYQANYQRFTDAIDQLDGDLKAIFTGKRGMQFMVFHPAWEYFARAYGLRQVPIEIEGKAPKPADLHALIQQARKEKIGIIFVQPQFSDKSAKLLAREIGGQVAVANPLAEDWMANMRDMAAQFAAALR